MKTLFPIIGQQEKMRMLHRIAESNHYANAYLLHGSQGTGKEALAMEFAAIMNCQSDGEKPCGQCQGCKQMRNLQHPNVHLLFALPGGSSGGDPLKGISESIMEEIHQAIEQKSENPYTKIRIRNANNIKISSVRAMQKDVHLAKSEKGRKVVLIFEAEQMNKSAFNSILKIVEEPPEDTSFIFTTGALHLIPETIRSRCQQIPVRLLKDEDVKEGLKRFSDITNEEELDKISRIASGDFGLALSLSQRDMGDTEGQILDFIRAVMQGRGLNIREQATLMEKHSAIERHRFLHLVQLWFRDARIWAESGEEEQLIFQQMLDKIQGFVDFYPDMDYESAQILLEYTIEHLERNVYTRLALISLQVQLNKVIKGRVKGINYGNPQRYGANNLRGI